ncbi:lipopolysaccharide kinase InaA family protein [Barnesiella sp. An55]|uniref:lipopolysaccharide kinase InaA family protein n=1 Tax=Barnesiella sp. An55 TaxID=1965646 RepID=UPI000B37C56F|nr:lipopolysaccharide kinase InaA family protein [Barnesiella sp. An55]OUN73170.1 hypothetical protein B5G10_05060 [Barnesiella sp. An55]HIZ27470.1 lipopolysaccharide kinase InaA family protein [Candidatus Barnesiella merdipullorum]
MKLVLNPSYRRLEKFMQELPLSFPTLGECIYKARNELRKFSYEGQSYVVKSYKVPLFVNRVAYTFFRPGKAKRAYEYALRLHDMGIETPTPVAYIEIKRGGLLWHSFFVSETCPYPRMMREFDSGGVAGREDILKAFAAFTADVHEKGVLHLDYSAGNILFDKQGDQIRFSILDLNRMRFVRMTPKMCLANFNRFCHDEAVVRYVVAEYARLRGWDEAVSVEEALVAYREFWTRIERKEALKRRRKSLEA